MQSSDVSSSGTSSINQVFHAVLQEVEMLKGLNYDRNIVQFYGACIKPGASPMLVCEFMEGGHILAILCHAAFEKQCCVTAAGDTQHHHVPDPVSMSWCINLRFCI